MVLKAGKWLYRIAIWSVTTIMLLILGSIIRLSIAPLDLDFARSQLESAAQSALPGWTVRFDVATVGWDFANMRPWISVINLYGSGPNEDTRIWVPNVELGLTRQIFFNGFGISQLVLSNPVIEQKIVEGGEPMVMPAFFPAEGGPPNPQVFKPYVVQALSVADDLRGNSPDLTSMRIIGGRVNLLRDAGDIDLGVPNLRLSLSRNITAVQANVDTIFGDGPVTLNLGLVVSQPKESVDIALSLSPLAPSQLASKFKMGDVLSSVNVPVSLRLQSQVTLAEGLRETNLDLQFAEGNIDHPELYPVPAYIRRGQIETRYVPEGGAIYIDRVDVDIDAGPIHAAGQIYWEYGHKSPGIMLNASLKQAELPHILNYWPVKKYDNGVERGGRGWVHYNVIDGAAYDVSFHLHRGPDGMGRRPGGQLWDVAFGFRDIDSTVMQTMPPVHSGYGRGFVTKDQLRIDISRGFMGDLEIGPSRFTIENLSVKPEQVGHFDVTVNGDVTEMLRLVDRRPLEIFKKANIDVERIGGKADVRAQFSVPLAKERSKNVIYDVSASVVEGRFDDILDGEGLRRGELDVRAKNTGLVVTGTGHINGVPLSLELTEDFQAKAQGPLALGSHLEVAGRVTEKDLLAFKVPLERYLAGPVQVKASFKGRQLAFEQGEFSADLTEAKLVASELGWEKPIGQDSFASGEMVFGPRENRIFPLNLWGDDLKSQMDIRWQTGSNSLSLDIDAEQIGANRFEAVVRQTSAQDYYIVVDALRFDMRPFIGVATADAQELSLVDTTQEKAAQDTADFTLTGYINEIILLNGESMAAADVDIRFFGGEPVAARVTGQLGLDAYPVSLQISGEDPGARILTVQSDNGGELLRGLGYFAHLQGGTLSVDGVTRGWGDRLHVEALAKTEDALLLPKSALDPIVETGTIEGVDSYIRPEGLSLNSVDMRFSYDDGLFDMASLKGNGGNLGLTMEGQIHTQQGKVNVNGVLIPAYGLNSLLGRIPILGGIFSGGEGKGLFGFAYRVKGPMAEPEVSFNALSGLAPGFLRGIFEGGKGKVDDVILPDTVDAGNKKSEEKAEVTEPTEGPF